MYYQRLKDSNGSYRATDGTRWELSAARTVRPTTGWAWFETTAAALAAWGLEYAPPETAEISGD